MVGTLFYGSERLPVLVDDVLLAHVQAVAATKLRRHEGFLLSWTDAPDVGHGRSAVWMHPTVDLHFKYDGGKPPALDQDLYAELTRAANGPRGLVLDRATLVQDPRRPVRRS
jgi:hypothetical protein